VIVPGTTVGVTLIPGFVEIRDKGIVKKRIPIKKKSFDEVLSEVELYFSGRGRRLAPYILKDILIKIGLPRVKVIIERESDVELKDKRKSRVKPEPTKPKVEEKPKEIESISESQDDTVKETPVIENKPIETQPEESGTITMEDFDDIQEALLQVDKLSDSFMSSKPADIVSASSKPEIKIKIEGIEEVRATTKTTATRPKHTEEIDDTIEFETVDLKEDSIIEIVEKDVPQDEVEDTIVEEPMVSDVSTTQEEEPSIEIDEEAIEITERDGEITATKEISLEEEHDIKEEIHEEGLETKLKESTAAPYGSQVMATASRHMVKPLVQAKALVLGEEGVGKSSLIENAGLEALETDEGFSTYRNARTFELTGHRVKLIAWSFEEAVRAKISRTDYYANADVIIIVYATCDRWSFESIAFWLKEVQLTNEVLPPVVLVGNKKDLRVGEIDDDSGDEPVDTQEGFTVAEYLAKNLGLEDSMHPIAFLETSCLTHEGVEDVFVTASELFVEHSSKLDK